MIFHGTKKEHRLTDYSKTMPTYHFRDVGKMVLADVEL